MSETKRYEIRVALCHHVTDCTGLPSVQYPQYTVNRVQFGTDYKTANMYWQLNGGVLMEKLDAYTPWHVLQSR